MLMDQIQCKCTDYNKTLFSMCLQLFKAKFLHTESTNVVVTKNFEALSNDI